MIDDAHDRQHDKMTAEHVELHLDEEVLLRHPSGGLRHLLEGLHPGNVKDLELEPVSTSTKIQ